MAISRRRSSRRCCFRPTPRSCCRMSTSPWTGRCSRRGRATKVFSGKTMSRHPVIRPGVAAIRRSISKASGREARLGYLGHVVMENRHGLLVDALVTPATGTAERDASIVMISRRAGTHPITVGADKAYDTRDHVNELRQLGATPHVAQYAVGPRRHSAIDGRTTRHPGYAVSQRKRKLVEQAFGWLKTVALLRKLRHRGGARVEWVFTFAAAAYNLTRMRRLFSEAAA